MMAVQLRAEALSLPSLCRPTPWDSLAQSRRCRCFSPARPFLSSWERHAPYALKSQAPHPQWSFRGDLHPLSCGAQSSIGPSKSEQGHVFIGFDFGTSGARAVAIDPEAAVLCDMKQAYEAEEGADGSREEAWRSALLRLLSHIPLHLRHRTAGISLDATSATTIIVSRETGAPLCRAMMYNESCEDAVPAVKAMAPAQHTTATGTSTLCKLVSWWNRSVEDDGSVKLTDTKGSVRAAEGVALAHQADWLLAQLTGWQHHVVTDYNNALKLGYDPEAEAYPSWLSSQPFAPLLPTVLPPASPLATVSSHIASQYSLPPNCLVFSGTTDSIAAFLAAQVRDPGEAVTSLGSTLAIKLLSTRRVDDARFGVYSHRLGDAWLVGGASNTGGAVLRSFFSDTQLHTLSTLIDPAAPSPLDYYPLLKPGERFPIADPSLQPRLTPRPSDDALFLHGLLESIARIEAQGYTLLQQLGATPLSSVSTAGGGADNPTWTAIRERVIGVPVAASHNTDAAFGAALLAKQGFEQVEGQGAGRGAAQAAPLAF